jgi:outer membrane receptor protein involved in Fe transport
VAYRTGFKSGGFGVGSGLQRTSRIGDFDFESENVRGFEVGARGQFQGGRLHLSAAAFAYNFSDLQVNTFNPAALTFVVGNASSLRQRGFEVQGNWRVLPDLAVRAALAYTHNRYGSYVGQCFGYTFPTGTVRATAVAPAPCSFVNSTALTLQQDFTGRAPARSPDWAGNAGFTYDTHVNRFGVEVSGDAFFSDSYFASETMAPSALQPSFWRFNASVALTTPDERYSIRLIGRNLTNEYYLTFAADRTGGTGVPGAIGEQRGVVARGREVALQLSASF